MSFLNFSLLIGNVFLEKQWQNSLLPLSEQRLTRSQGAEHVAGTRSVAAPAKPGQKCPVPEEQQCPSYVCCCRAGRGLHRQTAKQEQLIPRAQPLVQLTPVSACSEDRLPRSEPLCAGKFSAKLLLSWLLQLCRFCGTSGGESLQFKHIRDPSSSVCVQCWCLNEGCQHSCCAQHRFQLLSLSLVTSEMQSAGQARVCCRDKALHGLPKGELRPAVSGCLSQWLQQQQWERCPVPSPAHIPNLNFTPVTILTQPLNIHQYSLSLFWIRLISLSLLSERLKMAICPFLFFFYHMLSCSHILSDHKYLIFFFLSMFPSFFSIWFFLCV